MANWFIGECWTSCMIESGQNALYVHLLFTLQISRTWLYVIVHVIFRDLSLCFCPRLYLMYLLESTNVSWSITQPWADHGRILRCSNRLQYLIIINENNIFNLVYATNHLSGVAIATSTVSPKNWFTGAFQNASRDSTSQRPKYT